MSIDYDSPEVVIQSGVAVVVPNSISAIPGLQTALDSKATEADLTSAETSIINLQNSRTADEADIASLKGSRTTDEADIASLKTSRTADEATLASHTTDINSLKTSRTADEATLATHTTNIAANTTNIATNTTNITTNTTNISSISGVPLISALLAGVPTGTVTLTYNQFPDYLNVQRRTTSGGLYNKGTGQVTLSITTTAATSVLLIEYRLRDAVAGGNPTLKNWAPVFAFFTTAAGTATTFTISDLPATRAWYYLDIRINGDNTQVTLGNKKVGCGEATVFFGQSISVQVLTDSSGADQSTVASNGVTPDQYTSVLATTAAIPPDNTNTAVWGPPGDSGIYKSTGICTFLNQVTNLTGVNAGGIGHAVGNTAMATWLPGQGYNTTLKTIVTQAGGVFRAAVWIQGHYDAANMTFYDTGPDYWKASLTTIFNDLATTYPTMAFKRIICSVGSLGSSTTPTAYQVIRQASLNYVASDANSIYFSGLGAVLSTDNVHPSQVGNITLGNEIYRAWRGICGFGSIDNGPRITGATRSAGSAVIPITIAHGLGTGLTTSGTLSSQFAVYNHGTSSSPLTISSATVVSATEIDLTLSSAPANSQALDVYYRRTPDSSTAISSAIFDNYVEGDDGLTSGRQLRTIGLPIEIPPPTPTSTSWDPILKIDASNAGSLWLDTAFTTAATAQGALIAGWQDISAVTAGHFVQGTSARRPTLDLAVVNGLNAIKFTRANTTGMISASSWNDMLMGWCIKSFTIFCVWKSNDISSGASSSNNTLDHIVLGMGSVVGTNVNYLNLFAQKSGKTGIGRYDATGTQAVAQKTDAANTTLYAAVARVDLTNANLKYQDNKTGSEVTTNLTGTNYSYRAYQQVSLGCMAYLVPLNSLFDGWLCELQIFDKVLTDSDRATLLTYANTKWGA